MNDYKLYQIISKTLPEKVKKHPKSSEKIRKIGSNPSTRQAPENAASRALRSVTEAAFRSLGAFCVDAPRAAA